MDDDGTLKTQTKTSSAVRAREAAMGYVIHSNGVAIPAEDERLTSSARCEPLSPMPDRSTQAVDKLPVERSHSLAVCRH